MIITKTLLINLSDYQRGRLYDAGELDRHADELLSFANPGDLVRILVGDLEPCPVPESFAWVRPNLIYSIAGHPRVTTAWCTEIERAGAVSRG